MVALSILRLHQDRDWCDFGGYGYCAIFLSASERAISRHAHQSIFEGTNEINRMLIPGPLEGALSGVACFRRRIIDDEILSPSMPSFDTDDSLLAAEQKLAQNAKKVALMTLGTAAQKYMMGLAEQQEILMGVADIIMDAFGMESAILRTQKIAAAQGEKAAERYIDMTRVFCNDAVERIEAQAKNTLAAMSEGDELRTLLAALRRFTKMTPINTVAARQRIANAMIEATSTFTNMRFRLPIPILGAVFED